MEDLIKKLEKIEVPEIEITGHRKRLRALLLQKHSEERRRRPAFNIVWRLAPLGFAMILLLVVAANNLLSPNYTLAEIEAIAKKDPRVGELVEKGAVIKDIEIIENRAYVLVQSPSEAKVIKEQKVVEQKEKFLVSAPASDATEIKTASLEGVLVEVNLEKKAVTKLENFNVPVPELTESEQKKAREISENSEEIKNLVPVEAKIESIEGILSKFELKKKGESVRIEIRQKEALIRYKFDSSQAEARINLEEGRVESVEYLGETEGN